MAVTNCGIILKLRRFIKSIDMKTNDKKRLTSENGRPIADNQNTCSDS